VQLDRLAVQLRPRTAWEAVDLGFAMVRGWMPRVYAAWFVVSLPLFAVALLVLPTVWAATLLWWLKPLLDRVVLHVLANGVFGDLPRLRDTLRALPRALTPGLLPALTWQRFSLTRSFGLAVSQLERQKGTAARLRRRQLLRRVSGVAMWLTAMCVNFELALGLSIFGLYDLLVPGSERAGLFQLLYGHSAAITEWGVALTYFAVVTLVEPAYVAGGFALYLNRRTALEGWDLEVSLRRMEQRLAYAQATASSVAAASTPRRTEPVAGIALVILCALLALGQYPSAHAQNTATDSAAPSSAPPAPAAPVAARDPAVEVKKVYQRPELDPYEERTTLEWLGPNKKREERSGRPHWSDGFSQGVGQVLRILAWAALALSLIFLLFHLLRGLDLLPVRTRTAPGPQPSTLFGLDVRPESLPKDLAGAAAQLARAGHVLQALSLLYRGALATLLHRDGVPLTGGDTERDCLDKSRARVPEAAHRYFASLLLAWQQVAYAQRDVAVDEVEALCRDWAQHFAMPRTA
jgi:hypothetical protein